MAVSQVGWAAIIVAVPGLLSFVLAVIGENKKPTGDDVPQTVLPNGATYCGYPSDPSLPLGALAVVFLFVSALLAIVAFVFPYNRKAVPIRILWRSTSLVVFTFLSMVLFLVAEALLMWAIIVEGNHRTHNVHYEAITGCPTAKAGLLGGGGFLALDTTLFFLISLMLTVNSRVDYLGEDEVDEKGSYGEVAAQYEAPAVYEPNEAAAPLPQHLAEKV